MEEEVKYVSVTFNRNGISAQGKYDDLEVIYDEVKCKAPALDETLVIPEKVKKDLLSPLKLLAAGSGMICLLLVLVIIALCIHLQTVDSEHNRKHNDLTAEKEELWTERADLQRRTDQLSRDIDALKWTMSVILEFDTFLVDAYCPQKVCKPCLDGWVLFQTNCYLFTESNYLSGWRTWKTSWETCKIRKADLVVIESQDEQEFINNHTQSYNDDKHGYWIGLAEEPEYEEWMWVDGSNLTVTFWLTESPGYGESCVLTLPHADPLANWSKVGCDMKNRWICETRALIKPD